MRDSLITLLAFLFLVSGGSFIIDRGQFSLEKLFISHCEILVESLEEFDKDIAEHKSPDELKRDLTNLRKNYRRASVMIDYFFPYERKLVNPPDISRAEDDNPDIILEPHGLQVIERLLYTGFTDSSYHSLQHEVS